ncbi:hypothetical protein [Arthrobacter sp. 2MCAF14]|uniref:hypothetical protein n=1 Tax=Arthrobacter sp. 2MCAF14 TaxID=3232982 RepID=UPI003F91AC19
MLIAVQTALNGPGENALPTVCHRVIMLASYFLIDLTPKFLVGPECPRMVLPTHAVFPPG